jgi:two-component system, response regulator PdtaR
MSSEPECRILLVDDDRLILATLANGLQQAEYRVITAESVDEAEAVLAGGLCLDLVVLDVNMPDRSGLELAERLMHFDRIPFILLTAYSDEELIEQAAALGAMGYLVKPVDTRQLIPAIEAALSRHRELSDLRAVSTQLQQALNAERDISVAIGIMMTLHRLSREAAFDLLRSNARSQRRKLSEFAHEVISAHMTMNAVK